MPGEPASTLLDDLLGGVTSFAFGLRPQGHIPTIERMLTEGADWQQIGKAIGWDPEAAERHYRLDQDRHAPSRLITPEGPATGRLRLFVLSAAIAEAGSAFPCCVLRQMVYVSRDDAIRRFVDAVMNEHPGFNLYHLCCQEIDSKTMTSVISSD